MDPRIEDIVEDNMSSGVHLTRSLAMYVHFVWFRKFFLRMSSGSLCWRRWVEETGTVRDMGVSSFGQPCAVTVRAGRRGGDG